MKVIAQPGVVVSSLWVRYATSMNDEEIVEMARREQAFFGHIVERYEAPLRRYIRRLGVRNEDDQLDVMQEIFIKVYRNLNSFDTNMKFSSWIYRIAHNEAISWYRKRNVRPEGHLIDNGDEVVTLLQSMESGQAKQFDESLNAEAVNQALEVLDQKYRDPLILRYFEHKEYEEISDILRIPTGTVGTLVHRGKKQLAQLLAREQVSIS